jgi:hypothetical protein
MIDVCVEVYFLVFICRRSAWTWTGWVTPQKCPFTLSVSRLTFSIAGCPSASRVPRHNPQRLTHYFVSVMLFFTVSHGHRKISLIFSNSTYSI